MADFEKSYRITIFGNEGGYNPGVGENETYMGADRGMNPKWSGWPIIDNLKRANAGATVARLNMLFSTNTVLQQMIHHFYKVNYWDTLSLDKITDQQLGNNLFDTSVNPCIDTAAKLMQKACNVVIASTGSQLKPLKVDGAVGGMTIGAANALSAELVFNAINTLRDANYHERVRRTPSQAQWLKVWLRRLVPYHK